MKKLVSLVQLFTVEEDLNKNKISFYQYYDGISKENEYKILDQNAKKEMIVTKDQGNEMYKEYCKRAYQRLKIV